MRECVPDWRQNVRTKETKEAGKSVVIDAFLRGGYYRMAAMCLSMNFDG